MKMTTIILIITTITTALIAGLFYGYSCSVNIGLGKLPDAKYLLAMQSINKEIQNPIFFLSFLGTLILLPVSTYLHYLQNNQIAFWLLLTATIIYLIGVFGVTIFGNVPLNEALAKFNISSSTIFEITHQRKLFEIPWNKLHTIRTLASVISLVLIIIVCIKINK
jgi:uncharacterized membrane protein